MTVIFDCSITRFSVLEVTRKGCCSRIGAYIYFLSYSFFKSTSWVLNPLSWGLDPTLLSLLAFRSINLPVPCVCFFWGMQSLVVMYSYLLYPSPCLLHYGPTCSVLFALWHPCLKHSRVYEFPVLVWYCTIKMMGFSDFSVQVTNHTHFVSLSFCFTQAIEKTKNLQSGVGFNLPMCNHLKIMPHNPGYL